MDAVLFVDDDPNILASYTRVLRKRYAIQTALGGEEALRTLKQSGPFSVVVADMRMPGMDGVELLRSIRDAWPDTVRIMLTGNADMGTAVEAVNQGNIFRFLNKPCDPETLASALDAGIRLYRLITGERDLLEKTLKGSVDLLVELLSTLDPLAFGRAQGVAEKARKTAKHLGMDTPWMVGLAAVLSQIGALTVPSSVLQRARSGSLLNQTEREVLNRIPEIGSELLRHIPRLEEVAEIIRFMNKNFNGTGYPPDTPGGAAIPLGGRILRVVSDFVDLEPKRKSWRGALSDLRFKTAWYDPNVLDALEHVLQEEEQNLGSEERPPQPVSLKELRLGQIVTSGVETLEGLLVVPPGAMLGPSHLEKIRNFSKLVGLKEPIWVQQGNP